ncbi:MAG: hypothetical protein ABEL51_15160, partial [Salinibacter sp.]
HDPDRWDEFSERYRDELADRPEQPCHAADVHTADGAVWADAATDLRAPDCTLCATRLLVVPSTPIPATAPRMMGSTAVETRSHVAAVHVASDRFIRGPPSLTEARPA